MDSLVFVVFNCIETTWINRVSLCFIIFNNTLYVISQPNPKGSPRPDPLTILVLLISDIYHFSLKSIISLSSSIAKNTKWWVNVAKRSESNVQTVSIVPKVFKRLYLHPIYLWYSLSHYAGNKLELSF